MLHVTAEQKAYVAQNLSREKCEIANRFFDFQELFNGLRILTHWNTSHLNSNEHNLFLNYSMDITFVQNGQLCISGVGFSVWFRLICWRNASFKIKDFGQWAHLNGLSPLWVIRCRFNISFWMKDLLQVVHLNGFSPVCTRMCRVSVLLLGNHFWQ